MISCQEDVSGLTRSIISVCLIIVPALVFGAMGKSVEMGLAIVAGFSGAVIINIDKIEWFKAWKIEAKMRKTTQNAERVVAEATATVESLRNVATPLIVSTLSDIASQGLIHHKMKIEEMEEVVHSLEHVVEDLHLDESKFSVLFDQYRSRRYLDHRTNLLKALQLDITTALFEGCNELYGNLSKLDADGVKSKKKIQDITTPYLDKIGENTKRALDDYFYYLDFHKIRRPSAFNYIDI
jgi:hypothetical protein